MAPTGWLFDAYPCGDGMAVWLLGEGGRPLCLSVAFAPIFYAAGPRPVRDRVAAALTASQIAFEARTAVREELFSGRELQVLQVAVRRPLAFGQAVCVASRVPGARLFNCDLGLPQLFFAQTGLFPLGRYRVEGPPSGGFPEGGTTRPHAPGVEVQAFQSADAPEEFEYPLPPLVALRLRLEGDPIDPLHTRQSELVASVEGEEAVLCAERAEDLVFSLNRLLERYDPDVVLTEWGDSFLIPRLQAVARAAGLPLRWNRDAHGDIRTRRARSYVTYGQTVFTAGAQMLYGRWHIDLRNSFIYRESELAGLLEIARQARLPVQYLARTSIGTAISAMQLHRAIQRGVLIPWQKSEPEAFKSAEELLASDKGGLTYQPIVGAFERVGELDFSSMYPTIMARFNISPETVNCPCCPEAPRVPQTGARLCRRRKGLVPEVLEPLLARRAYYKRRRQESSGAERALYQQRQTALKWCLVCCLDGDTSILHRVNGRWKIAPIRDIVDTYLPGSAWGERPVNGLAVTGIDDRLRGCVRPVRAAIKTPAPSTMIRMRLRWGRELLVTPNHRCYVLERGQLRVKRADQLSVGDWIPLAHSLREVPEAGCQEVDLLLALRNALPAEEQPLWRVFGRPIRRIVQEDYATIFAEARRAYAAKTIWNWREYAYLPLSLLDPGDPRLAGSAKLSIGRGKRGGGLIQRFARRVRIDEELGFLLGFFVGDGSATRNTIRFDVGANEQEHLVRLRSILRRKFGIRGRRYREHRARMYVLQVNSIGLVQVFKHVFGLEGSADRGKLCIPELILNGPREAQRGFILGLLASDGYVSRTRNFLSICSADGRFVRQLSLLFALQGIDHRLVDHGHLCSVQTKNLTETLKLLYDGAPLSAKHLRALHRRRAMTQVERLPQIPVGASGLLELCRAVRVVRVPRVSRIEMASRTTVTRKLQQLIERRHLCARRGLLDNLAWMEQLLESPLVFSPVKSLDRIPYDRPYVYCFQLAEEPAAFFAEGGILTGNSFGYLGYRNARFGRIEAHEATTAFSREMLLRAKELAEARGYRMLHALVDSMWLHHPGASRQDYEVLASAIEQETGLPILVEGVYDWIAFLPSRTHPGIGVPNRYLGRFDDGTSKVRGIEVRRSDVPAIVERTQARMLEILFGARTIDEARARVPALLDLLADAVLRLRCGEARAGDLAITTTISRTPEDYRSNAVVAVAARQMARAGVRLHPGERIQYVITDAKARLPEDRVRPLGLLGPDWAYDANYYIDQLLRAAETLMVPLGYTRSRIDQEAAGRAGWSPGPCRTA